MNASMDAHANPKFRALDPSSATEPTLPSKKTLFHCPRFQILVIGNTGVGKSSLIASIFNISQQDIDIADGRAGRANIHREYTSDDIPCFALHDSLALEPGSTERLRIVEEFIRQRSKKCLPFEQQLHALWLCIETPRSSSGSRLMQTADENLLKLAIVRNIPIIVVFTKFDLLFNEFYSTAAQDRSGQSNCGIDSNQVAEDARSSLKASIQMFQQQLDLLMKPKRFPWSHSKRPSYVPVVGVSTNHHFFGYLHTLEELTEVTRRCLHSKRPF